MSGRVCYIARADRGSRIESLRLVGARTDERWTAPPSAGPKDDEPELFDERLIGAGADWVKTRTVGEKSRSGELALVCLDAEGFAAGWITSPSTESRVVSSVALSGVASEDSGSMVGPGLGFFLTSDREAGVQALAVAAEPEVKRAKAEIPHAGLHAALRVPVLAGADAPVRLFLDMLDQRGIAVDSVTTIWHAMARVWAGAKTSSPSADPAGAEIIAEDSGVTAVVLIDPRGRLLWSWSAKGELLAGGLMRLSAIQSVGRAPTPTVADASRLTNDWIAWGSQLGVVPRRVACIAADDPVGMGEDSASYKAGQFGAKLAGSWGGAGVDLVLDADPIGATLARLAATVADSGPDESSITGLESLSHRPGRAHKWMHAWVALGIAGSALLAGGIAMRLRSSAADLAAKSVEEDARWRSLVQTSYPNLMKLSGDVDLEAELSKILTRNQQERERNKIEPTRPIVQELETLSMALADPEVELDNIAFSGGANASVIVTVVVPDIKEGEMVFKSLSSISGSNIDTWQQPSFSPSGGGKIKGVFTGKWKNAKGGPPGAPAATPKPLAPKAAPGGAAPSVKPPAATPGTAAATPTAPTAPGTRQPDPATTPAKRPVQGTPPSQQAPADQPGTAGGAR